jgi:hypothetical protein
VDGAVLGTADYVRSVYVEVGDAIAPSILYEVIDIRANTHGSLC